MEIDQEKLEHTVLALLYLTSFKDRFGMRAWKGHDWEVMNLFTRKATSRIRLPKPSLSHSPKTGLCCRKSCSRSSLH